jgi:hypothetical protein
MASTQGFPVTGTCGKRPLALLDILGFRAMVARQGAQATASTMWRLQTLLQVYGTNPHVNPETGDGKVQVIAYSDSVLLWSEKAGVDGLLLVIEKAAKVIAVGMGLGVPLRGAVTCGDLCVSTDRQIFVGPGLVRAYDLEQSQRWGGAIVDPALAESAERQAVDVALATSLLRPYDVPVGTQRLREAHLALDWTRVLHGWSGRSLRDGFEHMLGAPDARAREKQDAILEFWNAGPDPTAVRGLREAARRRAVERYRAEGAWETLEKALKERLSRSI